jgi:Flp pilus assembly protein TadG
VRRQRGIATLEMAIAAPLLVLLMLATFEVGRAFVQYTALSNAVRNAARFVAEQSINGSTGVVAVSDALRTQAQNLVAYGSIGSGTALLPGLSPGQVTVASSAAGDVTVTVVYPYAPVIGPEIPDLGFGGATALLFNMTAAVTLRATGGA